MSYAVASQTNDGYRMDGYPKPEVGNGHGMVAHGLSGTISVPSVFRFIGMPGQIENPFAEKYSRDRHVECAMRLENARMQWQTSASSSAVTALPESATRDQPGEALANEILKLMHLLSITVGIRSLGYDESDIDELSKGTLQQHRVTKLSPRQPAELENLRGMFRDALDI